MDTKIIADLTDHLATGRITLEEIQKFKENEVLPEIRSAAREDIYQFFSSEFNEKGIALTRQGGLLALKVIKLALIDLLAKVADYKNNSHIYLNIEGISGSFIEGNPRLGIFPQQINYQQLEKMEGYYTSLIQAQRIGRSFDLVDDIKSYPSDIDLRINQEISSELEEQLTREIFEKYGVYFNLVAKERLQPEEYENIIKTVYPKIGVTMLDIFTVLGVRLQR